jgi:hypothetical protein
MTGVPIETDQDWAERERYWRARLRRLRFGVEPLAVQVEKYRKVTIVLSAVSAGIALMFLMIFSAFRRPDIGLVLIVVLFVPMISLAWLDFRTLAGRVAEYERERKKAKGKVS